MDSWINLIGLSRPSGLPDSGREYRLYIYILIEVYKSKVWPIVPATPMGLAQEFPIVSCSFSRFCLPSLRFYKVLLTSKQFQRISLRISHGEPFLRTWNGPVIAKEPQWDRGQWMQPSLITSLMIASAELTANSDIFFPRIREESVAFILDHSGLGISLFYGSILNIHNMGMSENGWKWGIPPMK